MIESIDELEKFTDLHPWYWVADGEKEYFFAVVSAFPLNDGEPYPEPGGMLVPHEEIEHAWMAEDGRAMIMHEQIAEQNNQSGDSVCKFIALAHATFMRKKMEQSGIVFSKQRSSSYYRPVSNIPDSVIEHNEAYDFDKRG